MRILLDTHIFLWAVAGNKRFNRPMEKLVRDAAEVFVSAASMREASIKASQGKLDVDIAELASQVEMIGFHELPVRFPHTVQLTSLPHLHKDPIDRILVAQAISESLRLMTADRTLVPFSALVLPV